MNFSTLGDIKTAKRPHYVMYIYNSVLSLNADTLSISK